MRPRPGLLMAAMAVLLAVGPRPALAQSPADDDPGMADYWRERDPAVYAEMMREARESQEGTRTYGPAITDAVDLGGEPVGMVGNVVNALGEALRNLDDVAPDNPAMWWSGKAGELLDIVNKGEKVRQTSEKDDSPYRLTTVRVALQELAKAYLGNQVGGFFAQVVATGKNLLAPTVAGLVGTMATETAIDALVDAAILAEQRNRPLEGDARQGLAAKMLNRARDAFDIPDSAQVVTSEDAQGQSMVVTRWFDESTGRELSHVTWFNALGHEVGEDFGERSMIDRNLADMGGGYREVGRAPLDEALGEGLPDTGDDDGAESPDDEEEEGDEEPDTGQPPAILDLVAPTMVVAQGAFREDFGNSEADNIVTTTVRLSFWNVGALAPGYGGATLSARSVSSRGPEESQAPLSGSFTGGPNGQFRFVDDESVVVLQLSGGRWVDTPNGRLEVTNPRAFAGWPKELE